MNQTGSSNTDGGNVCHLISKLCNHFSKNNPELSSRLFKLATNFLTSPTVVVLQDEQYIVNKIRNTLATKQPKESLQKFDMLYSKLQETSILHNKADILTLFYNLYKDSSSSREFTMLQEIRQAHSREIEVKSKFSFIPSDSEISYAPSHNSVQCTESRMTNGSDHKMHLALKKKSSSISCTSSTSVHGVTEHDLMLEVIYVMQGIEGKILKKELGGLGFVIDPRANTSIGAIQRSLMERISYIGFLHNQLKVYCDESDKQTSVIGQSLVAIFREELSEYYQTLSTLQTQLKRQQLTLRRIVVWMANPHNNLQWLAYIAEQCADKKGGALISVVHGFLQHGATNVQKISAKVLLAVCRPLYILLSRWLLDGELNDPCNEFFIKARIINSVDRLWHDKYHVRMSMVPSFISMTQANKILATGKNINFLRQICKDSNQLPGREALQKLFETTAADSLYIPEKTIDFHSNLENVYKETSHRVLHLMKDKYHLLKHLQAFRRYLLLGQGDFIRHLLELLAPELNKHANQLYAHTLAAILESAIRVTNAQYEDEDILRRLTVQLLSSSPGDLGWDVFTLVYIVDGPVGTLFEPAMPEYRKLFGSLWKAKRMEYVLSNMRKQQITMAKLFRSITILRPVLHQIHVLSSAMIHFLHQTQYYFLFEVLECSWAEMMRKVNQAESLDDVIDAHSTFLKSVQCGVLLDFTLEVNSMISDGMCVQLRTIYSLIIKLETLQNILYNAASEEHVSVQKQDKESRALLKKGKFSTSADREEKSRERQVNFTQVINLTKHQIKHISVHYRTTVEKYSSLLAASSDLNLQLLSVRLNFNDYYKIA